ncbi:MLO-like protein 11 [Linum perenne]
MVVASVSHQVNNTVVRDEVDFDSIRGHCPPVCMRLFCSYYEWCYLALIKFRSVFNFVYKGHESFASHDSLEQLHRLMFVLAVTHVSYSFAAIALAMIKIYSWRSWENQAKQLALQNFEGKGIHSPIHLKLHLTKEKWEEYLPSFFTIQPIHGASSKSAIYANAAVGFLPLAAYSNASANQ